MLIITAITLWLGLHVRNVVLQKAAVDEIRQLGGYIWYDYQCNDDGEPPGPFINPTWKPGVGDKVRELLGEDFFHAVIYVQLTGRNVADVDLSTLVCLISVIDSQSKLATHAIHEKVSAINDDSGTTRSFCAIPHSLARI